MIRRLLRALAHRGEVAEVPEPLPVWQGCRLNATPHWCFDQSPTDYLEGNR